VKIALLEFLTDFRIGGTERQVVNLVRALDRTRFDVHVACFRREGQFLAELGDGIASLTQYPLPSLHSFTAAEQLRRLARHIRRTGIQVVHTYGFYPNVFGIAAARLARAPVTLASIRDTGDHLTPRQRRLQRWACRFANLVLANAEAVRRRLLEEGYERRRVDVIRNGIAFDGFGRLGDRSRMRQELGLPAAAPVVAVFSRLSRAKGVDYFLEAAQLVARRHPAARFLIVGDCSADAEGAAYRIALDRCVEELGLTGRVVFTGFRCDVPALLSVVDVSVLPSLSEGLSNVVIESMAAGVPVVATAVGGNPELVADGKTGILVPPRDAAAIAGAVDRLLRDPRMADRLGAAGRRRAEERFSLNAMVRATESLYVDLVGARAGESSRLLWPNPSAGLRSGASPRSPW
jgi:glycosyltransferase involved in cell wall biosynthesis